MDVLLNDEQRMLQDSAVKFFARHEGVRRARGLRGQGPGFDVAVLNEMAAEGWLSMMVPESAGGAGLGLTELALVLEQAGRALAPEPLAVLAVSAAVLAGLAGAKGEGEAEGIAEVAAAGMAFVVPAIGLQPSITARAAAGGIELAGAVEDVAAAGVAAGYVLTAAADGADLICVVPRAAAGLSMTSRQSVDGRPLFRLQLDNVTDAVVVARGEAATAAAIRLRDGLLVAAAAELLGVMGAALDMTVDYLKIRRQFGKPIGSFQALQHRAVDDLTRIFSVRSLLFQAAAQGWDLRPAIAAALKAHACETALAVTKSAIQMHGAIGFTHEHDAGLYLKRAMWLSAWMGNAALQRRRYIVLKGA